MKFLKPWYIADSMTTPKFFSSISLGSAVKSSRANRPNASLPLVKCNINEPTNIGFFPDSRFMKRLFRYDVSVIQRSQKLNVVSIGNTAKPIYIVDLSIVVQEQTVCWFYGWYS